MRLAGKHQTMTPSCHGFRIRRKCQTSKNANGRVCLTEIAESRDEGRRNLHFKNKNMHYKELSITFPLLSPATNPCQYAYVALYGLAYACPHIDRKDNCSLKAIELLLFKEKVLWINGLSKEKKEFILEYHKACSIKR
jgi:hypothetical protein